MKNPKAADPHADKALELANRAILSGAEGDHAEALRRWQAASDYADEHLTGADIHYWIKSGLGASLFDTGDYRESIAVSKLALDWCLGIKQPLPSLTIARSCLKLGESEAAAVHLRQAYDLIGEELFERLEPSDRETARRHLNESR